MTPKLLDSIREKVSLFVEIEKNSCYLYCSCQIQPEFIQPEFIQPGYESLSLESLGNGCKPPLHAYIISGYAKKIFFVVDNRLNYRIQDHCY